MTYIVTTPCIDCKYTDCAAVCPVEAFHETPDRLLDQSRHLHRLRRLPARMPGRSDLFRYVRSRGIRRMARKKRRSRELSDHQHKDSRT